MTVRGGRAHPSSESAGTTTTALPTVSVIVPAYNAAKDLEACLAALDPVRKLVSEIIVVDDGSTDATASIARRMGARVIGTLEPRSGAATARNIGARVSGSDILVFVDADVCVRPGTVEKALALLAANPELGAVSGSYDDQPEAAGDLSVWRNLLHCHTHQRAHTDTRTFWTGCGAIRRELLERVGGFDRKCESIEDMELGARLHAEGVHLRLDPSLLVQHRKNWTFTSMVRTDVVKRAIPYTHLILRTGMDDDLNVRKTQRASVTLVWVAVLLAMFAVRTPRLLWFLPFAAAAVAGLNGDFNRFLAARRGGWFAVRMFPVHLLFFFYSGAGYLYARFGGPALRVGLFLVCALLLQWRAGVYQSEVYDPDEPAHFISALMVHDYLVQGLGKPPLAFARDYYAHYPKVALGHWPPMFYAAQALWMMVFPATRNSVLVMLALIAALLAEWTRALLRARFTSVIAWCGSLTLLALRGMTAADSQIMTEVPQTLLTLGAMVALGKYLDRGGVKPVLQFAFWSAATLLAKGSGLALAPVPVIGAALTGRWRLLRSPWFWAPVAIVLLVAGPWYLLAPDALHQKVALLGGPGLAVRRIRLPPLLWRSEYGWPVAILACVGLVVILFRAIRGAVRGGVQMDGLLAAATGLVIAASSFPFFFKVWEIRHQIEAAPAFILLAATGLAAGLTWLEAAWLESAWLKAAWLQAAPRWPRSPRARAAVTAGIIPGVVAIATAVMIAWNVARIPVRPELGYRRLAQAIMSAPGEPIESALIVANPVGEGAFIAELAQLDTRPGRFVLRSTKVLAQTSWQGGLDHYYFKTRPQLDQLLAKIPVQLVVVDQPFDPEQELLLSTLATSPDIWTEWRPAGLTERLRVFRRVGQGRLEPVARDKLAALQQPD